MHWLQHFFFIIINTCGISQSKRDMHLAMKGVIILVHSMSQQEIIYLNVCSIGSIINRGI